jgi:hypothetical protein
MSLKSYDYLCRNYHVIDFFDWDNTKPETINCPNCGQPAERVWLRSPGMSPDRFWSGINYDGVGYVTSRTELKAKMEAKGQGFVEPGVFDEVARRKKQIAADNAVARRKVIEDTLYEHKEILQDEFHKRRLHSERYRSTSPAPVEETKIEFKDFNIPEFSREEQLERLKSPQEYDFVKEGSDIKEIAKNV